MRIAVFALGTEFANGSVSAASDGPAWRTKGNEKMSNCARMAATKNVAALKAEMPCAPEGVKDIGYAQDVFTRETMREYLSKDTWKKLLQTIDVFHLLYTYSLYFHTYVHILLFFLFHPYLIF